MPSRSEVIYPLYYYSNYIHGSDREFIWARMAVIPKKHQDNVASRYERIYRDNKGNNRKRANTFLHKIAKRFRDAKS